MTNPDIPTSSSDEQNITQNTPSDLMPPDIQTPSLAPVSGLVGKISRFRFVGSAGEYFGIWIVNIMLTIVTLGIYSPWAKVRRMRYFYGHTTLAGEAFDYTGDPKRILIGRLIAVGVYAAFMGLSSISQITGAILLLSLYFILPWLLVMTYRFTARNSIYRNIRFVFTGATKRSYVVFFGPLLLTILTLGIAAPYSVYKSIQFKMDYLKLGNINFKLNASLADYYKAIGIPLLIVLLIVGAAALLIIVSGIDIAGLVVLIPIAYFAMFFLGFIISGLIFKKTWSNMQLGNNVFTCDLKLGRYVWIQVSNLFARIISFGFLSPWATIRLHQYQVQSLYISWKDDPAQLIASAQTNRSAVGEELADFFDFDVSI